MADLSIIWDDDADPDGNVQHIAEHGLTTDDVEHVLLNPETTTESESSRRPIAFGYTVGGDYIAVAFEWVDDDTVYPITAYEVPEPK